MRLHFFSARPVAFRTTELLRWFGFALGLLLAGTAAQAQTATDTPVIAASAAPVVGGSITLSVTARAGATCQWRYRGTPIAGATSTSLTLDHLARAQNGYYDVVLTASDGVTIVPAYDLDVAPATMPDLYQADATFAPRFERQGAGAILAAVALDDGKVLVGGDFTRLGDVVSPYLARFNADGTIDAGFVAPELTGPVRALARTGDGHIYVGGDFAFVGGKHSGGIFRLDATLRVDATFATGGGFDAPVRALGLQADGRLMVGGDFKQYAAQNIAFHLARLNADGSRDSSFSFVNGIDVVRAIAVQPDGKVIAGGGTFLDDSAGISSSGFIKRFLPSGQEDGTWSAGNFGPSAPVSALALLPNGQTLVGGAFAVFQATAGSPRVTRLAADGHVDGTFQYDPHLDGSAEEIRFLADAGNGRWFVAGKGRPLTRINADGSADATFVAPPFDGQPAAVTTTADGTLRLWGNYTLAGDDIVSGSTTIRADATALSPASGVTPRAVAPIYDAQLVAGQKLLVRGGFTHVNDTPIAGLARLNRDGSVDATFAPGGPALSLNDTGRIAVQGDGTILVHNGSALERLTRDGALDSTFTPVSYVAGDVALDRDGNVLIAGGGVGGVFTTSNGVRRLTSNGALDASFQVGVTGQVKDLFVQTTGRIILGGQYGSLNGGTTSGFAAVSPAGAIDTTWNAGYYTRYRLQRAGADRVWVTTPNYYPIRLTPNGGMDTASLVGSQAAGNTSAVLALPDGRLLRTSRPPADIVTPKGLIDRYSATLTVDRTFQVDGADDAANRINRLLLEDDGSVLVFGSDLSVFGHPRFSLFRLAPAMAATIVAQPVVAQADVGGSAQLSVNATGAGPLSYQWYRDGIALAGATSSTLALSDLQVGDLGQFTVRVTNPFGSVLSAPTTISGRNPAPVIDTAPVDTLATAGTATQLNVVAHGTGALTYQWRRSGLPIPGANGPTLALPSVSRTDAGFYDVVIADGLSATSSPRVRLDVAASATHNHYVRDAGYVVRLEGPIGTINAIVPAPGGTFLVSGDFSRVNHVARTGVARLHADFSIDPSFTGPTQLADVNANGSLTLGMTRVLAALPDGRSYVTHALVARSNEGYHNELLRLLPDGEVDPTFHASTTPATFAAIAVQPNGGLFALSANDTLANRAGTLYHLNADGSLDAAFAPTFTYPAGAITPRAIAVQSDGRVLVSGGFTAVSGTATAGLVRLNADGAVDPTFAVANLTAGNIGAIAIGAGDDVIVAGSTLDPNSGARIVRLDRNGTLKNVPYASWSSESFTTVRVAADGTILAATDGNTYSMAARWVRVSASGNVSLADPASLAPSGAFALAGDEVLGATLALPNRTLLTRFAADGLVLASTDPVETVAGARALVAAPGGKAYVAGDFTRVNGAAQGRVARLNADGTRDPAFAVGSGFDAMPTALLALPDSNLIVGGSFTTYQGAPVSRLVRLNAAGQLDPTFRAPAATGAITALALLADGRICASGALYFKDGSRDASIDLTAAAATGLIPLSDGWLALGVTYNTLGTALSRIARYALDGTVTVARGPALAPYASFALKPQGTIVIGATWPSTTTPQMMMPAFGYQRLADLAVDTTPPRMPLPRPAFFMSNSYRGPGGLIALEDGRVLVNDFYALSRLSADGTMDADFSIPAVTPVLASSAPADLRGLRAVVTLDDGRLLLADEQMNVDGLRQRGVLRFTDPAVLAPVPAILDEPMTQSVAVGLPAHLQVNAAGDGLTYQWYFNGTAIAGATTAALDVDTSDGSRAGQYTVRVTSPTGSVLSRPALVVIGAQAKITGDGSEVGTDIRHPNGNVYDQVLLSGATVTLTADHGQVTRASFIDLSDDIVQVEFSGAGSLTISLANATGPALPMNYNQDVRYMRGHAGITISGADETTNVSVFSVGRMTAVNQALFRDSVDYDGMADIAYLAIASRNGKFGGVRAANASFFGHQGVTGLYAPGVTFTGPVYIGEVDAFDAAVPMLMVGAANEVLITGGALRQTNGEAIEVESMVPLHFANGTDSHGNLQPAQPNAARFELGGVDVTEQLTSPP